MAAFRLFSAEIAETGAQCANGVDDDADVPVNDGWTPGGDVAGESGDECLNATDDDGDGKVNDGCPRVDTPGVPETACDASLFGFGDCAGASDGLVDTNTKDGAPMPVSVEVGSP